MKLFRCYSLLILLLSCAGAWAQDAVSPAVDPKTGIVHSQRLRTGVPFGGIGVGTFQWRTDGTMARLPGRSPLATEPSEMPACFGAVWTRVGGKTEARVLALRNGYDLPGVAALDYDGLYPQARLTVPNSPLPLEVSLLAFTPLIPYDLKNSTLPAASFVFRLHNATPVAIETAVALSWGEDFGSESQVATLPDEGGFFSLRMSGRTAGRENGAERAASELSTETTLMAFPPSRDTLVTRSAWSVGEKSPGWWTSFATEGSVPDQSAGAAPPGRQNASVVVVHLTVRPGATIEVPFAVSWFAPHHYAPSGEDLGHAYQNAFKDSHSIARYLLDNWRTLYSLTEEWQKRLVASNYPVWLSRRLINSATPLTTDSLHTRDGRFVWQGEPGSPDLPLTAPVAETTEAREARLGAFSLLLSLYPNLAAQEIRHAGARIARTSGPPPPDEAAIYTLLLAQYALWTNDSSLPPREYPHLRRALAALLPPESGATSPAPTLSIADRSIRLAALRAGQALAELDSAQAFAEALKDGAVGNLAAALPRMEADRRLALACRNALKTDTELLRIQTQSGSSPGEPPLLGRGSDDLFGEWYAASLGVGTLSLSSSPGVAETVRRQMETLDTLLPMPSFDGLTCLLPASVLSQSVLAIWQNRADAGVHLLQSLTVARSEGLRSPWQSPLRLYAGSGQPLLENGGGLAQAADWNAGYALTGFGYDPALGRLTLSPKIPGTWRTLTAPIFAPTFWARIEYKPQAHGGTLNFRLDRFIAVAPQKPDRKSGLTRLILKSVRVPGLPGTTGQTPVVHVSLGSAPLGVRTVADSSGDLIVTFATPLSLAAGDRLEVDVH